MRRPGYWILALLGLGFGLGLPLLLGGQELLPVLASISWQLPVMLILMISLAWNFNTGRLLLLLGGMGKKPSYGLTLETVLATEFAFCVTPGGSGGLVTYTYLLGNFGLSSPQSLAICAIDQLMDVLFFITALTGIMVYWFVKPTTLHPGWQMAILALIMLGGVIAAGLFFNFFHRFLNRLNAILRFFNISRKRRRALIKWLIEFHRSLQFVRGYAKLRLIGVYLFCLGYWLMRYSVFYVVIHGLNGNISWSYCFITQMFSHTVGQATMVPGGSGGAEVSSSLFLTPLLGGAQAAAVILLWRFATFYFYLVCGGPAFARLAGAPLWHKLTNSK